MTKKSFVHVFTGNGGGKTTAALGVALRSLGHGHRVAIVQFMKGRKNIGEYKIQKLLGKKLADKYHVYQFGREGFVNLRKPSEEDKILANQALGFAREEMLEKLRPDVLILDEINLAADIGLISVEDVIGMLNQMPPGIDIYMTGRNAPRAFLKMADFVVKVKDEKRPDKFKARNGIEF